MNVLIDLRWMAIGKAGGMEQLAFEMVAALARVDSVDTFFVYCPRRTFGEWRLESGCRVHPLFSDVFELVPEIATIGFDPTKLGSPRSRKLGIVEKSSESNPVNRIIEVDLVHSIGGYISSELRSYCNVVTILDLQHVHYPEFFSKLEIETREANHQLAIELADRVICISNAVMEDVRSHFSVPDEKLESIWVIPSSHAWLTLSPSCATKVLKTLGVRGDFIFYPSHSWTHKNHVNLLKAFARVKSDLPELKLVLTGGGFDSSHPAAKRVETLGLSDSVMHLGYCTPLEIRCLMQQAQALVYPSLFEGFGLPVAEAIIAGTPVACSNIKPLLEIGGDAVVVFDPHDVNDIASKVLTLLNEPSLKADNLAKGRIRKKVFTPDLIGLKTANLYRSIMGAHPLSLSLPEKPNTCSLRHEKARHWGRYFGRRFREGKWIKALGSWTKSFVCSPRIAMAAWQGARSIPGSEDAPFEGRYGDGWIGPFYREWLMVPEGSSEIEIHMEPPPEPFRKSIAIEVAIAGQSSLQHRFESGAVSSIKMPLPNNRGALVPLKIVSSFSFVPREQGHSADERELSVRLAGLRWS